MVPCGCVPRCVALCTVFICVAVVFRCLCVYPSTAAPDPPGGISAFIDSTGFMHTTWTGASSESGVTQYNMEYRVMNRMDSNQITVPARMTEANVSSLRIQVLYEVRHFPSG